MAISVPDSPKPVLDKNINQEQIGGFTVALSHFALANMAERQCRISNLQDNIVDAEYSRLGLAKRLLLFRLTVRKWIDGKSLVVVVCNLNCIVEILKRGNRQKYPKYFF